VQLPLENGHAASVWDHAGLLGGQSPARSEWVNLGRLQKGRNSGARLRTFTSAVVSYSRASIRCSGGTDAFTFSLLPRVMAARRPFGESPEAAICMGIGESVNRMSLVPAVPSRSTRSKR
jgi:hypothetical protein